MEQTLVLVKPDGIQRGLIGEIVHRFERKGLKLVGMKMMTIDDVKIEKHYEEHLEKPFFPGMKEFMQSGPVVAMVLEGVEAIEAIRIICGTTKSRTADAGTIRGDFGMSLQNNLVHASDSPEAAKKEISIFFDEDELFGYDKKMTEMIYSVDER